MQRLTRPAACCAVILALTISAPAFGQTATKRAPKKKAAPAAGPSATAPAPAKPAPEPPPSDLKLQTRYTVGPQVSENSTYIRGQRQRVEFPGIVSIAQCDEHRTVFLNDRTHTFAVQAEPQAAPPAPELATPDGAAGSPGPTGPRRTGIIVYQTTITDTGERKQVFGREARHITVTTVKDSSAACRKGGPEQVQVDAWYVDLPEAVPCAAPAEPPPAAPPTQGSCTDRVETRAAGQARLGFAVNTTTTTTVGDGDKRETMTTAAEVTALDVTRLDPALFDVPAGYTEVARPADLVPNGTLADALMGTTADGSGHATPKNSGTIRIAVPEPANHSQRSVLAAQARRDLVAGFRKGAIEALPVAGGNPEEMEAQARRLECEYLLLTDVTEVKTSKPGKVGGLLHKASGDAPSDSEEASVAWKLVPVGGPAAQALSGTEKASSGGGFSLGSAVRLAAFAGSMYMTFTGMNAMMGGSGGGPLGAVNGGGSGLMDPRGSALMTLAQSVTAGGGGPTDSEQAVRMALTKAFEAAASNVTGKLARKP